MEWALHYVLFGAICTAFSFDAWKDAYYSEAVECLLDNCERVCVWLHKDGAYSVFVKYCINNFRSLSSYLNGLYMKMSQVQDAFPLSSLPKDG